MKKESSNSNSNKKPKTVGQWVSKNLSNIGVILSLVFVVVQLEQNKSLTKLQIHSGNIGTDQAAELAMFGESSKAWAKSIENPGSLTSAEIKVIDGWLHNQVLQWERTKLLKNQGLLSADEFERKITKGVRFYFGNRFAMSWWKYEKINSNLDPDIAKIVDSAIGQLHENENLQWLNQLKKDITDVKPSQGK